MTFSDLKYPFYGFPHSDAMKNTDLSFAYHVVIDDGFARAMCNDIVCDDKYCPFSCKEGKDRQQILLEFAKTNLPELMI